MLLPLLLLAAQAVTPSLAAPRADANRDGVITRAEAQANADARFVRFDTDRNGTVTPEERRAVRRAARNRPITAAEFQRRAQARFARIDADYNGVLSGDERRASRRMGPRRHRGGAREAAAMEAGGTMPAGARGGHGRGRGQGAASLDAAQFRARALARFDRLDANRDGRLDQAEIAARRAARRPAA